MCRLQLIVMLGLRRDHCERVNVVVLNLVPSIEVSVKNGATSFLGVMSAKAK